MDKKKEQVNDDIVSDLASAKDSLFTRRKALKEASKKGIAGLGILAFLGLGLPGLPIKEANAACLCSGCFGCGGCLGCGPCMGCTGTCTGPCEGCLAICRESCSQGSNNCMGAGDAT